MTTLLAGAVRHLRQRPRSLIDLLLLRRQRRRLAALDDHMLEDIGVTRDAAETEARRTLWDVPNHWRA